MKSTKMKVACPKRSTMDLPRSLSFGEFADEPFEGDVAMCSISYHQRLCTAIHQGLQLRTNTSRNARFASGNDVCRRQPITINADQRRFC